MRITAGQCKGMKLSVPKGKVTRPVPDKVKQAVFSSLGSEFGTPGILPELAVLDIFAGSGAFGLEAVSRGANRCCFVEKHPHALSCLRQNIEKLKLSASCWILAGDAFRCEIPDEPTGTGWQLVFLDPPYPFVKVEIDKHSVPNLLAAVSDTNILAQDALLILRHPAAVKFDRKIGNLIPYKTKTYSTMICTWFRYDKQI